MWKSIKYGVTLKIPNDSVGKVVEKIAADVDCAERYMMGRVEGTPEPVGKWRRVYSGEQLHYYRPPTRFVKIGSSYHGDLVLYSHRHLAWFFKSVLWVSERFYRVGGWLEKKCYDGVG